MPRVYNLKRDGPVPGAVYIGRPCREYPSGSKWANPFHIGRDGSRLQCIAKYKRWLPKQRHLMESLHELRGKDFICHCDPEECHGHWLVEIANPEKRKIEEEEL